MRCDGSEQDERSAVSQRDMAMILIDFMTGDENVPIIVSDLRAEILEARQRRIPLYGLDDLDQTDLFTLLSTLKNDGLVERRPQGYVVNDSGRALARELRAQQEPHLRQLADAAQAALSRAS
jgi:hypothetical protein